MDKLAWTQGYDAYENKKGVHSNPYDKDKQANKYYSWRTGFYDAKDYQESDVGDWFARQA